jgi:hypothetical protein
VIERERGVRCSQVHPCGAEKPPPAEFAVCRPER